MLQPIKVSIRCMLSEAFQFDIFPEMQASELSQFILNCQLLHETDEDDDDRYPYRLISTNFNPIIDFMLANPTITIGQIYDVFRYIKAKEELSLFCLKQSDFEKHSYYHKVIPLPIAVYYQPKTLLKELQTSQRFIYSYQMTKKEEQQQKSERKTENWFTFSQQVHLDSSTSNFLVYRYIMKSQLSNFQKVENVFLLKKRLIELHNEHLHLFGQLKQIKQEEDRVSFVFLYVPCVSFSEIMHFELSSTAIYYLINKMWMFVLTLIQNNFENYIYNLYKRRTLKQLFDSICLCFNHRLIITDLNILLQRGPSEERLTHADHEKIIEEINIYVKLNKSQLIKYDDKTQVDQNSHNHPISCFTFSKIYLSNSFHFFNAANSPYEPKTNTLMWKPQFSTPQNERKMNMNEATTAKKPKAQTKNMEKMTKKEQNKSLNRSRAYESVKKTKCRRNY